MSLPPGPTSSAAVQTWQWLRDPVNFMERCAARYGSIFTLRIIGDPLQAFVWEPDAVKQIFAATPEDMDAGKDLQFAEIVGRSSLLLVQGDEHFRLRRLMAPAFRSERFRHHGPMIASQTEAALARWPLGTPFSLHKATQELSLRVLVRIMLGLKEGKLLEEFVSLLNRGLDMVGNPLILVPFSIQRLLGPWAPWAQVVRLRQKIDDIFYTIIREHRAAMATPDGSLLSELLMVRDEEGRTLSDEELRDAMLTFLLAANDTTAVSLCWVIHELAGRKDLWERLAEEVQSAMGDGTKNPDRAAALPLLDGAVRESLRLRPAFPIVTRQLRRPMQLLGYELPAGLQVVACAYLAHRHPSLYPDPEQFRPERFLHSKPKPSEWFPFGGGFRRCIGGELALYVLKIMLARLVASTSMQIAPGPPVRQVSRFFWLIPSRGMSMILRERRSSTTFAGPASPSMCIAK